MPLYDFYKLKRLSHKDALPVDINKPVMDTMRAFLSGNVEAINAIESDMAAMEHHKCHGILGASRVDESNNLKEAIFDRIEFGMCPVIKLLSRKSVNGVTITKVLTSKNSFLNTKKEQVK